MRVYRYVFKGHFEKYGVNYAVPRKRSELGRNGLRTERTANLFDVLHLLSCFLDFGFDQ